MIMQLDEGKRRRVKQNLSQCIEIADHYRTTIGDEDSIILQRNLRAIEQDIGLDVKGEESAGQDRAAVR